jgi:hypothetical protein
MPPSLGWHDPIWQQLYGSTAPAQPQQPAPHTAQDQPVHYLDQLQAAAAAGQTLNLSDMPGFQSNLQVPA